MRRLLMFGLVALVAMSAIPAGADGPLGATIVGEGPVGDDGFAEIGAYDQGSGRYFAVNNSAGGTLDVYEFDGGFALVDAWALGGSPNSVDVYEGLVAVAVGSADKATIPGAVQFYDADTGTLVAEVTVGYLPDMVTFTADGRQVVVANEGEPSADYSNDPPGSVSIIDTATFEARHAGFEHFSIASLRDKGVRIGRGETAAQDLEPEYVALDTAGRRAYVTLQENNAVAVVDLEHAKVLQVRPLGTKDMAAEGYDFTNDDGGFSPVVLSDEVPSVALRGLYMPDAIAAVPVGNQTLFLTANEGDAREYPEDEGDAFLDTDRLRGFYDEEEGEPAEPDEQCPIDPTWCVSLDPALFDALYGYVIGPDGNRLGDTDEDVLGRLNVSLIDGDEDGDGDIDSLHMLGARSMSVWSKSGKLVWDSGNLFTTVTAAGGWYVDGRSDDKGSEPEAVTTGTVDGTRYAFVGLERTSGIVVFDLSDPMSPVYDSFIEPVVGGGDIGDPDTYRFAAPEGLEFVSAAASPTGEALLIVAHEGADDNAGVVVFELTS